MAVDLNIAGSRRVEEPTTHLRANGLSHYASVAFELAKVRVSLMVVVTAAVGFVLATVSSVDWMLMLHTLVPTGLLAGGAAALNQLIERDFDRQMQRTANRPLPSGRVSPLVAGLYGVGLGGVGFSWLLLAVNPLTAALGAATFVLYVLVYTPLKRITIWNTVIGAIPGAIPPLMGWAAVRNDLSIEAWLLFAILFCWQMPHFYAIAWLCREDYRSAGYRMLSHHDETGWAVGWHSVAFATLLGIATVWLFSLLGTASAQNPANQSWIIWFSGVLGVMLSGYYAVESLRFASCRSRERAKRLFLASIVFVPLLCVLLVGVAVLDNIGIAVGRGIE